MAALKRGSELALSRLATSGGNTKNTRRALRSPGVPSPAVGKVLLA